MRRNNRFIKKEENSPDIMEPEEARLILQNSRQNRQKPQYQSKNNRKISDFNDPQPCKKQGQNSKNYYFNDDYDYERKNKQSEKKYEREVYSKSRSRSRSNDNNFWTNNNSSGGGGGQNFGNIKIEQKQQKQQYQQQQKYNNKDYKREKSQYNYSRRERINRSPPGSQTYINQYLNIKDDDDFDDDFQQNNNYNKNSRQNNIQRNQYGDNNGSNYNYRGPQFNRYENNNNRNNNYKGNNRYSSPQNDKYNNNSGNYNIKNEYKNNSNASQQNGQRNVLDRLNICGKNNNTNNNQNSNIGSQVPSKNVQFYLPYQQLELRNDIPIYSNHREILQKIYDNQVVVVSGETGCGKSTQLPQYIYRFHRLNYSVLKQNPKILVSQPRRIAAQNLSRRVQLEIQGYEQDQNSKKIAGYQIGYDSSSSEDTQILFVTAGLLLQKLVMNPKKIFETYQYFILDEVHERDIDIDFILLTFKHFLNLYPNMKLILMSATIDNQLFSKYFGPQEVQKFLTYDDYYFKESKKKALEKRRRKRHGNRRGSYDSAGYSSDEDEFKEIVNSQRQDLDLLDYMKCRNPCPIVFADNYGKQRKKYRIDYYYLDDIPQFTGQQPKFSADQVYFSYDMPQTFIELYKSALQIIEYIHMGKKYPLSQSVLIFLPGISEIYNFLNSFISYFKEDELKEFELISLHSKISEDNQFKVFEQNQRMRKIIVATNVAESSITVPDVVYVIDFCLTKQLEYQNSLKKEKLILQWSSQASQKQRAGRTGRVQDGIVFKLIPKEFYDTLQKFSTPEIQRISLDKTVLKIKLLNRNQDVGDMFEDPVQVMGRALQPPSFQGIITAYKQLTQAGALSIVNNDSMDQLKITNIGIFYSKLPIDIVNARLILMGYLCGCLEDALIIACMLQQHKSFFRIQMKNNAFDFVKYWDMIKQYDKGQKSDMIIRLNLFKEWYSVFYLDNEFERQDLFKNLNLRVDIEDKRKSQKMRFKITTEKEKKWCMERFIDVGALRDIQLMYSDIKVRLLHMGFSKTHFVFEKDLASYERLHIAMGGTFYNSVGVGSAQSDQNNKKIKEREKMLIDKYQVIPKNSLILNSHILNNLARNNSNSNCKKLQEYQNIIQIFGNVEKIIPGIDISVIEFEKNTAQESIRKLLFIRNAMEERKAFKQYRKSDKNYQDNTLLQELKVLEILGDMECLYQQHLQDYLKGFKLFNNPFSINIFNISNDLNQKEYYISSGYQMRGSYVQYCDLMSKLPNIPYIQEYLYLLFSSFVNLKTDRQRKYYQKVKIEGRDDMVFLEFQLTNDHLSQINQIRHNMKNLLQEDCFNQPYEWVNQEVWQNLNKFLHLPKLPYVKNDVWEGVYLKSQYNIDISDQINQRGNSKKNGYGHKNSHKSSKDGGKEFFGDIQQSELQQNIYWKQINQHIGIQQYIQEYNQWKLSVLEQLDQCIQIVSNNDAYLCCSRCNCMVTNVRNLEESMRNNERGLYCSKKQIQIVQGNNDQQFLQQFQYFIQNNPVYSGNGNIEFQFFGCKNNGHVLGYIPIQKHQQQQQQQQEIYKVSYFSPLQIQYPNLQVEQLDFQNFNSKEVQRKETQSLQNKFSRRLDFQCMICFGENLQTIQEFKDHIQNVQHQENLTDFRSSIRQSQFQYQQQQSRQQQQQ